MAQQDWKAKAEAHKTGLLSRIPKDWLLPSTDQLGNDVSNLVRDSPLLSAQEHEIVQLDATGLRDALAARTYTAVDATTAYAKAAALAHQAVNCLMDFFLEEALERARWLDAEYERTGKPVGPLHGVPISVKDPIHLKGHDSTAGFLAWVGTHTPKADGTICAILRAAGANFYVKTATPQAIMMIETQSYHGVTVNPHNRTLTSGGSTGGEGALIAAGGSVLGIGTDIGGSIRNPSACSGIFGFKPTAERLPNSLESAAEGNESILSATGPMGRSARDIELFVSTILAAQPWKYDCTVVAMPWRPEEIRWIGGDRPRIGVLWHDGEMYPQLPTSNALKTAVDKLKAAGFEVVDYKPYRSAESWDIISQLFFTDGGKTVRGAVAASGEPLQPALQWILSAAKDRTQGELYEVIKQRDAYRNDYTRYWNAAGVDVVLSPPSMGSAQPCGKTTRVPFTSIWNLVDYPAAVFPTGQKVQPTDKPEHRTEFLSDADKEVWAQYDSPETFANAPLALMVIGQRWEDEKVVKAMQMISEVVRGGVSHV